MGQELLTRAGVSAGTLYAAIGLLFGALLLIAQTLSVSLLRRNLNTGFGAIFGIAAIILFPIVYGAFGFIVTLLLAAPYNFLASIVGEIQIVVE